MAGKLSGSAIQSGTITSTQLSTELGPVTSELQLVGSGVSLNVSNNAVFSGNVGIGTTSPAAALDVTGNIAFSGILTSSSATANGVSYFNASKVLTSGSGLAFNGAQFGLTNSSGAAILKLDANTVPEIDFYISGSIKSYIYAPSTSLQFNTVGTNPILFMPNESERMRVDSNGNVGIGTTSPAAKLDVALSSTMGAYGPDAFNLKLTNTNTSETNSGSITFVGYSGNGISPYQWGSISAEKQTSAGDTNYGGKLHLWTTSGGANGEANSGQYRRLTIDAAGNVGIGTTSPQSLLHMYGASSPFLRIQAGGGAYSYIRLDDGNSNGYLLKNVTGGTGNGALPGALYTYTDNNCAFQHLHSGTALFTILSSGIVTMPTQTMISARHTATETPAGGTVLLNWAIDVNQGGGSWNAGTGTYTVPVAGRYMVTCSLLRQIGGGNGGIVLHKNGASVNRMFYCDDAGSGEGYEMGSGQLIVNCGAGDSLRFMNESTVGWYGDSSGLGSFTINLLG